MLKLGICKVAQDTPAQRLWRRGLTAASLLALNNGPTHADEHRFERTMRQICLSSGVAKTTARQRFAGFDNEIQAFLRTIFPVGCPLLVEDWAVSNGVTAAEWFARLRMDYPEIQFTASDWTLYLIEARREQSNDIYIVEPNGTPIQYIRPPFVVSLIRLHHWFYFVNRRLQQSALREWSESLSGIFRVPAQWDGIDGGPECVKAPPFVLRRLPLVHPDVMQLRDKQFCVRQHSVFTALAEPVDLIRTMNILNRAYFSVCQLRVAALAIARSLRPGGLWIVGRTAADRPPRHDVTVFRKANGRWNVLFRLGKGSEVEEILSTLQFSA